jgi:hypothetical protein
MTLKASGQSRRKLRRIPKERRINVRREEFNRLIDMLNERGDLLSRLLHDQQIQFQRIAQIQAEVDLLKQAVTRLKQDLSAV